jgi:hypothetical protein
MDTNMQPKIFPTAREMLRHAARHPPLDVALRMYRRLRGHQPLPVEGDAETRFSRIYADGIWRNGEVDLPASGRGSSLAATETVRANLPAFLNDLGVRTLLDIGCGDFTWMRTVALQQSYVGVDIVRSVVEKNSIEFDSSNRRFLYANAITDDLPDADAVLCREVLFHLSFADILQLLANVAARPRRYLIATTDDVIGFNADAATGDFRLLNLRRKPFRLPEPIAFLNDSAVSPGRKLAAWWMDDVRQCITDSRENSSSKVGL